NSPISPLRPKSNSISCLVVGETRLPSSKERYLTPVVTPVPAKGVPLGKVVSATVNGLNAFWMGTLKPVGLKPMPRALWNGSGVNGVGAKAASKNDRAYLKSANTVRYLSQRSRVNDP